VRVLRLRCALVCVFLLDCRHYRNEIKKVESEYNATCQKINSLKQKYLEGRRALDAATVRRLRLAFAADIGVLISFLLAVDIETGAASDRDAPPGETYSYQPAAGGKR
jgi:hypothetical protein